jgi:nitric oxide reductase subunit C
MRAKTAKWIFYLGTLISLVIFLGLTIDTHRQVQTLTNADKLSEQVVAGKRVWQKYNCNDCHTILGFGGYYAPDMTKVYWRRGMRASSPSSATRKNLRRGADASPAPE